MAGFFLIDGVAHPAWLRTTGGPSTAEAVVATHGDTIWIRLDGHHYELRWQDALSHFVEEAGGDRGDVVHAPMPGAVVAVMAAPGDALQRGDAVMIIESMKLETTIRAPRDGVVARIEYAIGATFERDAALLSLEVEPQA